MTSSVVYIVFKTDLSRAPWKSPKWHTISLYCALHPICLNEGHFGLHYFYLGDLQYNVHCFKTQIRIRRPLRNHHKDTLLNCIAPYIKIVKMEVAWRWPPLFLPRWPPVWCTSFLNSESSQTPFRTIKMTPHLTILRHTSKLSEWRSFDPTFPIQVTFSVLYIIFKPGIESSTLRNH